MNLQLGAHQYSTLRGLDAFTQLHVARKLTPAIAIVGGLVDPKNQGKDRTFLIMMAMSRVNDADSEYIVRKCLAVVGRHQPEGPPALVLNPSGGVMFDDLTMKEMLDLTIAVVEENLGDFFRTALAGLEAEARTT